MGTPGVPWKVNKDTIVEALKKNKGVITRACKDLDCDYTTLKRRVDADPELKELLSNLRQGFDNMMLDTAEETVLYAAANRQNDLSNALKSSIFILNNKGKERGYAHPNASDNEPLNVKKQIQFILQDADHIIKEASPVNK